MHITITGASRGIGAALAERYRTAGNDVLGTATAPEAGSDLLALDVTEPADFAGLSAALDGRAVDLLVCNAGVYLDKGAALETGYGAEDWAKSFAVNVTGVFLTVQTMLPNLRAAAAAHGVARIAVISSQMASHTRAPGGSFIYRASKAAALNLGRNLAADLKPEGIAVGIYHPGWVRTDMGGGNADISVAESAAGLKDRFGALSLDRTGCFEAFDGEQLPF